MSLIVRISAVLCLVAAAVEALTVPKLCKSRNIGYKIQDPEDCHSFYVCLGSWGEFNGNCASGYRFNETQQKCIKGKCPPCPCLKDYNDNSVETTGYIPAMPVVFLPNTSNNTQPAVGVLSEAALKEIYLKFNNESLVPTFNIISLAISPSSPLNNSSNSVDLLSGYTASPHLLYDLNATNALKLNNMIFNSTQTFEKKIVNHTTRLLSGRVTNFELYSLTDLLMGESPPQTTEVSDIATTEITTESVTETTTEAPTTLSEMAEPTDSMTALIMEMEKELLKRFENSTESTPVSPVESTAVSSTETTNPTESSPASTTESTSEETSIDSSINLLIETTTVSITESTSESTTQSLSETTTELLTENTKPTSSPTDTNDKLGLALGIRPSTESEADFSTSTPEVEESTTASAIESTTEAVTAYTTESGADSTITFTTESPQDFSELPTTVLTTSARESPNETTTQSAEESTTPKPVVTEATTQSTAEIEDITSTNKDEPDKTTTQTTESSNEHAAETTTPSSASTTYSSTITDAATQTTQSSNDITTDATISPAIEPSSEQFTVSVPSTTLRPAEPSDPTTEPSTEITTEATSPSSTVSNQNSSTPASFTELSTTTELTTESTATTTSSSAIEASTQSISITSTPESVTVLPTTVSYTSTTTETTTSSGIEASTNSSTPKSSKTTISSASNTESPTDPTTQTTDSSIDTTRETTTSSLIETFTQSVTFSSTPESSTVEPSPSTTELPAKPITLTPELSTKKATPTTTTTTSYTTIKTTTCAPEPITTTRKQSSTAANHIMQHSNNENAGLSSICANHMDGYFIKDPKRCNKYYTCYKEQAYPQLCPGQLLFDDKLKICNYPDAVECQAEYKKPYTKIMPASTPKPIPTVTRELMDNKATTKIPTNNSKLNLKPDDCSYLQSGTFVSDHKNCNKYYVCLNGYAVALYCPRGQYFDIEGLVCNFKSMVKNCPY